MHTKLNKSQLQITFTGHPHTSIFVNSSEYTICAKIACAIDNINFENKILPYISTTE